MTLAEIWSRLPNRTRVWWTALDVATCYFFHGEDITLSERWARLRDQGDWRGIEACKILDAADPGHCDRAIKFPTKDRGDNHELD